MEWRQISPYCLESDTGYRVAKLFTRQTADYLAYAPNPNYRREQHKARYALGESTPQSYHCLGRFCSASEARRACLEHLQGVAA